MKRNQLIAVVVVLVLIAGVIYILTQPERLWSEAVNAVTKADCQTAEPLLIALRDANIDGIRKERARIWKENCFNYTEALKQIDANNYVQAELSFLFAIKPEVQQHIFFPVVAQKVQSIYDNSEPLKFIDYGECSRVSSSADRRPYFEEMIKVTLLRKENLAPLLTACTGLLIDKMVSTDYFYSIYDSLNPIYEQIAQLIPSEDLEALKRTNADQLYAVINKVYIGALTTQNSMAPHKLAQDFAALYPQEKRITALKEKAMQWEFTYIETIDQNPQAQDYYSRPAALNAAIEQLESFTHDYPDHALVTKINQEISLAKEKINPQIVHNPVVSTPDPLLLPNTTSPTGQEQYSVTFMNPSPYYLSIRVNVDFTPLTPLYTLTIPPCTTCSYSSDGVYDYCSIGDTQETLQLSRGTYYVDTTPYDSQIITSYDTIDVNSDLQFCVKIIRNQ